MSLMPSPVASLEALRTRIRAIEAPGEYRVAAMGAPALDAALPWGGLPRGCLHEIAGTPGDAGAAIGFAAALVARLHAAHDDARQVLWCVRADTDHETGALYAPGLRSFGLAPRQVLLVRAATTAQVLWAMEEGLARQRPHRCCGRWKKACAPAVSPRWWPRSTTSISPPAAACSWPRKHGASPRC
jgi:protein ImuA